MAMVSDNYFCGALFPWYLCYVRQFHAFVSFSNKSISDLDFALLNKLNQYAQ